MKKILLVGLGLIVLLFTIGCSQPARISDASEKAIPATSARSGVVTYTTAAATKSQSFPVAVPAAATAPAYNGVSQSSVNLPSDRMVVRTGSIQMVVNQISAALDSINQISARYGGYVVNSQQWKEGDRNIGSISIRVLADSYDKAMADLRLIAKSITSESTTSQDVTEEYSDLSSRIKNLQAAEAQLLKIMENATKTEDILSIQRELTSVRGQIEQIKGRMIYLERTSSTSLININLEEAVLAIKFNANKVSGEAEAEIKFTSEVIGGFAPYNYQWDFGDGKTSTEASPSHAYKAAGTYTVVLRVTDDKGYTNILTRAGYINIISSWKPGSVAKNAWSGFVIFGKGLVNSLIWISIFSLIWIPIGAVIWYFAYYRRHKKQRH